ncbi:ATP-binding protein [Streptosporangium carneum]|uniref:ATP-binding protein n=1 Tax=Streptosporangium carneum TaxID=47481 RepID=UPI0022F322C6|nr:ATP-binding protein [Streptosporangium carneum]
MRLAWALRGLGLKVSVKLPQGQAPDPGDGAVRAVTLGVVDLPGVEQSVSAARQYVAELLTNAGHTEVEDAVLLVSEVVTNAVVHPCSGRPGGVVTVEVTDTGRHMVCVEVIDDGSPSVPVPRLPEEDEDALALGGRGLWLVDAIAESWGVRQVEKGRVAVWMHISTSAKPGE